MLMLMMMMSSRSQAGSYRVNIETYDGQEKTLAFETISDMETFFETDFEIIDVDVPELKDLSRVKRLIQDQDIMDVNRKAIIKIEKQIEERVNSKSGNYAPRNGTSNPTKVYDFNLHEKDIHRI